MGRGKWSSAGQEVFPRSDLGAQRKSGSLYYLKMNLLRNSRLYCFEMKLVLEEIFGNYNNKETTFQIGILERIKQIFVN